MPPRPNVARAFHLPVSAAKSAFPPSLRHPKPHLARYHLNPSALASSSSSSPAFIPPISPQLPPRRQPAFNPGGFGLQSHPGKGKERALEEIERRDAEIGRDERRLEGREGESGEEAEAFYVVSASPYIRKC